MTLADHEINLWDAALSRNSSKVYNTAMEHFQRFVVLHNRQAHDGFPELTENLLVAFVTYCACVLKLRYTTIKLYLSGIRFHYLKAGKPNPLSSRERLDCILRGIRRRQNVLDSATVTTQRIRRPITYDILYNMCVLLKKGLLSPNDDLLLLCVCQMAFFGFLRCGEFTVSDTNCSACCLMLHDVSFSADKSSYSIRLKVSKTDPFGQGVYVHIFESRDLSPVANMAKYYSLRLAQGASSNSPLLVDSQGRVLTRTWFINQVHHMLQLLGLDSAQYNGHSFRIGAATSAAAVGIDDHLIKALGRWSSTCYTRYIHITRHTLQHAQLRMTRNGQH